MNELGVFNVLFICTSNSSRSIIAESILNGMNHRQFRGFSAGSHPKGTVNPIALKMLKANGLPVDGLRSKDWSEFSGPNAPRLDFVFTVCDQAAGETCPIWIGHPVTAHWGVAQPSLLPGENKTIDQKYLEVISTLRRRIELLLALPIEKLDRISLQQSVREMGKA
jgi:arsenate reductase